MRGICIALLITSDVYSTGGKSLSVIVWLERFKLVKAISHSNEVVLLLTVVVCYLSLEFFDGLL